MDTRVTPVLGVTQGVSTQKQKRNRKTPSVNATFRIPPDLKAWLEEFAEQQLTTAAAVVVEQLQQLHALVRITTHISASMQRNMARYEKQSDFMRAMAEKHVRHMTTWEAGGTLENTVHRLAWDSLQQWLKQDPAERDAWLRFVVEGTEYWTPPASMSGDLFAENDMVRIDKPADPAEQEQVRKALQGMRVEAQSHGAPRVVKPVSETHVIEAVEE